MNALTRVLTDFAVQQSRRWGVLEPIPATTRQAIIRSEQATLRSQGTQNNNSHVHTQDNLLVSSHANMPLKMLLRVWN